MEKKKLGEVLDELRAPMESIYQALIRLEKKLPQITKERQESEQKRPPRNPLADAW